MVPNVFVSHIISISSSSISLMEFKYSLQSQINMEEEITDDDVFYAELRRQILVLTADDDDYGNNRDVPENKHLRSASGAKQGTGFCCSATVIPGSYFSWLENEGTNAVPPTWLVNLWRTGNGTGVFIPHIVKSRRRHKNRGRNNDKGRIYKPMPNKNE
ncbi:unnamed protein product [Camellia sinensis]